MHRLFAISLLLISVDSVTLLATPPASFMTGYALNGPPLRNDFSGWVGMKLTVGTVPIVVSSLGRVCVAGNALTHTVKFANVGDGSDVPGASVVLTMAGCTPGQFVYGAISPVTLPAGANYYLASQETQGGDRWYDQGGISATSAAVVNSSVYFYNGNWIPINSVNTSYVPPNFQYSIPTAVTLQTNPSGPSFSVDGAAYTPPQTFSWTSGSSHTIAVTSPQNTGTGTQYVWSGWSDGGAISHTVSPTAAMTLTASFLTQYLLSTSVSPPGGGSITASPATAGGYYNSGTAVQLTATASPGCAFVNWSGALSGVVNPQTLSISAPLGVTANFQCNGTPLSNFVVSYALNGPPLRNDFSGWVGMKLTVGSTPIVVSSLGRVCVAGNALNHTVKFANVSDGTDVPGASVLLTMAGCTPGQFVYGPINPVTLPAGGRYYLASQETQSGDRWLDQGSITTSNAATVNSSVYFYNGSWIPINAANTSYVPPSFQYSIGTATQYLLSTGVSPPGGGGIVASPTAAGSYYNAGAPVQLTAVAASGCTFVNWSGAFISSLNPLNVTVSSPLAVTANFQCTGPPSTSGCSAPALSLAQQQLTKTMSYIGAAQFPLATDSNNSNRWNAGSVTEWTSGFFPGWIWYMYEQTLDNSLLARAKAQTANLIGETTDASGHDVGFRILGSYGNGYRITRDPAYLQAIQTAAGTLATLYRPAAGVINSWPYYSSSKISVIVDNMMNLELLFYAAQNGGDPNWTTIAVSHALKTMQNNVRPDGSTYQGVEYNTDGSVYSKFTSDGYSASSTWSRGQAWGLYGFTLTYRYTQDSRFLTTAQQLADYFIQNLPSDFVPYWDFSQSAPSPRDSSAAAIAAAGLLELSTYVAEPNKSIYRTAALNIQMSLSSSYLGNPANTDGILLHGTYSKPDNFDVDTSLIWGDYYFIKGCAAAMSRPPAPTNVVATAQSPGQVNLTWTAQTGAIRYSVKRSTASGGPYITLAPPPLLTTNGFADTSVVPGTTYYYVISAIGVAGEGPNSIEAPVIAPAPITVTLQTSPSGASFSVDGAAYTTPQTFSWASGSSHTIAVTSPQNTGAGTQYVWSGWSDGGAISHTVSPTAAMTLTASFLTQYLLSTSVSPPGGGSITASPATAGGYYNSGTGVQLTATGSPGCVFVNWSGALSGVVNPQTLTISAPLGLTANFQCNGSPLSNFVIGYGLNGPPLRNDFSGWVGMKLTVGSTPIVVSSLGRVCVAGNALTHTVKFANVADGTDVPGASVLVTMAGCTPGQFVYGAINPVTLPAGTRYYLASQETQGGDRWFDQGSITTSNAAIVNSSVYFYNGNWIPINSVNTSYVPVNFQYAP